MGGENFKELGSKLSHDHDFIKDLDGQVTCSSCGAMDDDMLPDIFENQIDFE